MKCRIPQICVTEQQVREELNRQFDERSGELYDAVKDDIVAQLMATMFVVLHNDFHFGSDRLQRVKTGTEAMFKLMLADGIMGKPFNTLNCVEYMQKQFGIDFGKGEQN